MEGGDRRTLAQMASGFQEIPGGVPRRETFNKRADPDQEWWISHKHYGPWRRTAAATDGSFSYCPESSLVHKLVDSDHCRRVFQELARQGHGFQEGMMDPYSVEMAERYAQVMRSPPSVPQQTPRSARRFTFCHTPATPRGSGAGRPTSRPSSAPPARQPARPSSAPLARQPAPPREPRPQGGRPAPRGSPAAMTASGNQAGPPAGRCPSQGGPKRPTRPRSGAQTARGEGSCRANSARGSDGSCNGRPPTARYRHIVQGAKGLAWVE